MPHAAADGQKEVTSAITTGSDVHSAELHAAIFNLIKANYLTIIAELVRQQVEASVMRKYDLMLALLSLAGGCTMRSDERLLAVGGVHALEGTEPCQLSSIEPSSALQDLAWKNALVVRAQAEGHAELACGGKRARLRIVKPARLDLVLVDERVTVGKPFHVRAVPRAGDGKELEVGKWTEIAWRADGAVTPEKDASAGEFGACDSCFGIHAFRASAEGEAKIDARLGEASGTLRVIVGR